MASFIDNLPIDMVNFNRKLTPNVVSDKEPSSYTTVNGAAIICNLDELHTFSIFAILSVYFHFSNFAVAYFTSRLFSFCNPLSYCDGKIASRRGIGERGAEQLYCVAELFFV